MMYQDNFVERLTVGKRDADPLESHTTMLVQRKFMEALWKWSIGLLSGSRE
jgi:hypothetical protein